MHTIVGVGLDATDIDRITDVIERYGDRFLRRIFTDGEIAYCTRRRVPAIHFAGRFAAKEAGMKALGTGHTQGVLWRDLEVVRRGGPPQLQFHGGAARRFAAIGGRNTTRTVPTSTPAARAEAAAGSSRQARAVANTTLSASQIYSRDAAGVVAIMARTGGGADEGTGIVLNDEGLIMTNDHVVAGATSIEIGVGTGSSKVTRAATLIGEEANSDLALIKVDPSGLGLKPLKLASASSVHVGDHVDRIQSWSSGVRRARLG